MSEVTKSSDLRKFISSDIVKEQIAKALPSICSSERFIRIAMTAITKTPKLAECTQESFITCLLDLAQLGIEADGRRAHLLPYGNKCTLIIDYKGLVELVKRSGDIVTIHADKVCINDDFVVNMGEIEKHVINFKKDRGEVYAYYCYAKMKDGSKQTEVMTVAEVDAIKKRSRASGSGPWVTDYDEMAKKTVFKRLSKWLPMSPDIISKVEEIDNQQFDFEMPAHQDMKVKSDII
jgi:recombination protein RecT